MKTQVQVQMSVLVLKHISNEGPGSMQPYWDARGISYKIIEPADMPSINSLEGVKYLIVMGGTMGVYERDQFPQVAASMRLIEQGLKAGIKVMGVCLGAQMLAHVLGGQVYKGKNGQEVGWLPITLTKEGMADPAMAAYTKDEPADTTMVFHWHGDTFMLPQGAVRLAGSALYENQAFRHGNAYALQYHIEITPAMIAEWFADMPTERAAIDKDTALHGEAYARRAGGFYKEFFGKD